MKNKSIIFALLVMILVIAACDDKDQTKAGEIVEMETKLSEGVETLSNPSEEKVMDYSAKISNVYTDLAQENGWSIVSGGVTEMTITVEAENVDVVLFWIAPTGTGTGLERVLIGYDLDGSDGWSINWKFGNRTFHDHITVQVLGSDYASQASETFNVHTLEETEGE